MKMHTSSTIVLLLIAGILFSVHANWEILDLPTDRGFGAIWAINEQTLFADGHEGLWKTFDGTNWVLDTTVGNPVFIYFADDTLGFLNGKTITINGGKTWQLGDTLNGMFVNQAIAFPRGQSFIGYGANSTSGNHQYKTSDGGWHWEKLPPLPDVYPDFNEDIRPLDISFPTDLDTGYLAADCWKRISDSEIEAHQSYFKTTDGGQTWTLNEEGLWNDDFNPYLVDFPENATVGYMVSPTKLFKTQDGGTTWDTVISDLSSAARHHMCFPENHLTGYVLDVNRIHRTLDGGNTWQTFELGQDTVFACCHFLSNWVGFISGTGTTAYNSLNPYTPGFVLKTTDGLLGIAEEPPVTHPSDWRVITPIGQEIVLRYSDLPHGFHASVFDASGRKIEELHSTKNSGQIVWGEGYSSGVYFIRARGTENNHTARVVIVR